MPMTANGLAKLLEELGELAQVTAKKLAYFNTDEHPDGAGSLRERMEQEMGDVTAAMAFVQRQFALNRKVIDNRACIKLALYQRWHADADIGAEAHAATYKADAERYHWLQAHLLSDDEAHALNRAIADLEAKANRLHEQLYYSAEFPACDAELLIRLRDRLITAAKDSKL